MNKQSVAILAKQAMPVADWLKVGRSLNSTPFCIGSQSTAGFTDGNSLCIHRSGPYTIQLDMHDDPNTSNNMVQIYYYYYYYYYHERVLK